ncbi:MAG: EscU/YscU/HrcU family type III secretion system export apparatus switch protein [Lachnobacterium sp.]|uniref:EscU/YscU/HrcU family type III secretion system export apparatus switch protein n=1 Tax=Agathobacter sp. TaxID=2021311 RepID=UPI003054D2E7|nr:EscU/YscU/HrcU family type III secretion system export apparatus switch protein [Lachnobacterium sp.]
MAENGFKPFQFSQLNQKKKSDADKTAVAISYEPGEAAPKILATGKGKVAEKIIETAKENKVPTYKDNKLASTLSKLQIGDMIPPELYEVVAEILVFVDDMDRMKAKLDQMR